MQVDLDTEEKCTQMGLWLTNSIYFSGGSERAVPGAAGSASPGMFLEMPSLRPYPRATPSGALGEGPRSLCVKNPSRGSQGMLILKNHCSKEIISWRQSMGKQWIFDVWKEKKKKTLFFTLPIRFTAGSIDLTSFHSPIKIHFPKQPYEWISPT